MTELKKLNNIILFPCHKLLLKHNVHYRVVIPVPNSVLTVRFCFFKMQFKIVSLIRIRGFHNGGYEELHRRR
jgi:hypothetical protein